MTTAKHPAFLLQFLFTFSQGLISHAKKTIIYWQKVKEESYHCLNMANIWMRGLKLSNPSALRNLNFVQRGLPFVSKGHTGGDADLGEKTTNIFTRKPKYASGGLIHLFSTAATARMKDPPKPPINKGDPGQHNNQPVKGPKQPPKETVSDRQEEAEAKNK